MKTNEKANAAANQILELFQEPDRLPKAMAHIYLNPVVPDSPSAKWSISNRMLMVLAGTYDARGFNQWKEAGRPVKKGAKAFPILAPNTRKIKEDDGTERIIVTGFRGIPVFRIEDTDGPEIEEPEHTEFINALPLIDVARAWGIKVKVIPPARYNGAYFPGGNLIHLGVENLSTWAHELIHAADDRAGNLSERGQHWRSETVATFGSAVLLTIIGHGDKADLGGAYRYIEAYAQDAKLTPVQAAMKVLDRINVALSLILETAETTAAAVA